MDGLYGTSCKKCGSYNVVNNGDIEDMTWLDVTAFRCCNCGEINSLGTECNEDDIFMADGNVILNGKTIFLIERYYDGYHGGGFIGFCLTENEAKEKIKELDEEAKKSPCSHCGYVHTYSFYEVSMI